MKSNRHLFYFSFRFCYFYSSIKPPYIIYILQYRDENKNLNYNLHKSLE